MSESWSECSGLDKQGIESKLSAVEDTESRPSTDQQGNEAQQSIDEDDGQYSDEQSSGVVLLRAPLKNRSGMVTTS